MSELSCHFKIFIANIKMIPQKKTYMRRQYIVTTLLLMDIFKKDHKTGNLLADIKMLRET
jgi:hypothetical protein